LKSFPPGSSQNPLKNLPLGLLVIKTLLDFLSKHDET